MSLTNTNSIERYIEDHLSQHLAKIQEFLRQPSISDENLSEAEKVLRGCSV